MSPTSRSAVRVGQLRRVGDLEPDAAAELRRNFAPRLSIIRLERSAPITSASGNRRAIATAAAPVPVPRSSARGGGIYRLERGLVRRKAVVTTSGRVPPRRQRVELKPIRPRKRDQRPGPRVDDVRRQPGEPLSDRDVQVVTGHLEARLIGTPVPRARGRRSRPRSRR